MNKKKALSEEKEQSVKLLTTAKEGILAVLAANLGQPMSNADVLNRLQEADKAVGRKKTSLGTFYPTAKKLEKQGFIKGEWGKEVAPGAKERLIQITGTGLEVFNKSRQYRDLLEKPPATAEEKGRSIPGLGLSIETGGGAA